MAEQTGTLVEIDKLTDMVEAACWNAPQKETVFRRLETRDENAYERGHSWMLPLKNGTAEVHGVELVPCDGADEGSVALRRNFSDLEKKTAALTLHDLWAENTGAETAYGDKPRA